MIDISKVHAAWVELVPNFPMWKAQKYMLNTIDFWQQLQRQDEPPTLRLYLGMRQGHTVLIRVITDSHPLTTIACSLTKGLAEASELSNFITPNMKDKNMSRVQGKTVIFDAGPEFIPNLSTITKHEPAALIFMG